MKTRICKVCGESFIPISNNQHYCKQIHKRTCSICGKEFDYRCEADSNSNICYDCRGRKYKKICKVCGKEFISKTPGRQICDGPHYRTCEICGKQFEVPRDRLFDNTLTCCSKECSNVKRSKAIKDSIKMKPKRYNAPKTVHHKICKFCGKPFDTIFAHKEYCDRKHYQNCLICGKPIEIPYQYLNSKTFGNTCSVECRNELRKRTNLKLYGVENYAQTDEWKCRVREIQLEVNKKRTQTMKSKYGVVAISLTDNWLIHHMSNPDKITNLRQFIDNPENFITSMYHNQPTVSMLSEDLGINESSVLNRIHNVHVEHLINLQYSSMEVEIDEFIHSLDPTIEIIHDDRNAIKPKEIDLYLPKYKLGIECDPTSTHNSSHNFWNTSKDGIDSSYHRIKTDLAEQNDIFLLHIFGYEWNHKKDIVKSIIINLLHKSDRIYARKCEIKDVDSHTAMKFLDENHRQGALGSSTRLGLYYQNELVSLMTFGKSRHTIGKSENYIELLRFCNKLNTTVIGGASKLFKYFIKYYDFNKIISFSDRAHTSGNMYKLLGFELDHISEPGYVWVDEKTDIVYHRINAQKQNIKRFLNDDSIDLSQSETQIMESHGFVKVYDSGTCTWVYESL